MKLKYMSDVLQDTFHNFSCIIMCNSVLVKLIVGFKNGNFISWHAANKASEIMLNSFSDIEQEQLTELICSKHFLNPGNFLANVNVDSFSTAIEPIKAELIETSKKHKRWTLTELYYLRENYAIKPVKEISVHLNRTENSVQAQAYLLCLTNPKRVIQSKNKEAC